jgi:hypothetical protein
MLTKNLRAGRRARPTTQSDIRTVHPDATVAHPCPRSLALDPGTKGFSLAGGNGADASNV